MAQYAPKTWTTGETITAAELNAIEQAAAAALTSVNGKTGTVVLSSSDVGAQRAAGPANALARTAAAFDPRFTTYNMTPANFRRGRAAIAKARLGLGLCNIAIYGDSRAQGSTLSPQTKSYQTAYPALLRKRLTGTTAGGLSPFWDNPVTDYDDRWTISAGWTITAAGPFDSALRSTTTGTVTFTDTFDSIAVYTLYVSTAGKHWTYTLDGGATVAVATNANRIGTSAWCRTVISAGSLSAHTIVVGAESSSTSTLYLGGFEPMLGTTGFRVHSIARAGYDYNKLLSTDGSGWKSNESTWAWKAPDIGILDLAINSFNNQRDLTAFRTSTQAIIDHIGVSGDTVLVVPYDYPSTPVQPVPLDSYISVYYDLAETNNLPLIDLNWWFKSDSAWPSNPSGYFGDGIHFTNPGHSAQELVLSRALGLTTLNEGASTSTTSASVTDNGDGTAAA